MDLAIAHVEVEITQSNINSTLEITTIQMINK